MDNPKRSLRRSPARKSSAKTPGVKRPAAKTPRKEDRFDESDIRDSAAFFRHASSRAEAYANDPERLRKLFEDAIKKSQSIPKDQFAETWAYVLAMIRLVRAYYTGAYREIPWQSLILILVAVIYFVSPIDLIPDWIPVPGLIDDALVVGSLLKSVKDELDTFMEWETAPSK